MSVRRMTENQVFFRQHNEQVLRGIDEVKRIAAETQQESFVAEDDTPLHFYCECSDENCRKRVVLIPSEYISIHKVKNCFVVIPGHENKAVERAIRKETDFFVVQKFTDSPETTDKLHATNIRNI